MLTFLIGLLGLIPFIMIALGRGERSETSVSKTKPLPPSLQFLYNVLSRVPDGKDIAHEHFASMQVLSVTNPSEV